MQKSPEYPEHHHQRERDARRRPHVHEVGDSLASRRSKVTAELSPQVADKVEICIEGTKDKSHGASGKMNARHGRVDENRDQRLQHWP